MFYFISFVVLGVMVILNLFIGVITAEMSALKASLAERERERDDTRSHDMDQEILNHIQHLEDQVEQMRKEPEPAAADASAVTVPRLGGQTPRARKIPRARVRAGAGDGSVAKSVYSGGR